MAGCNQLSKKKKKFLKKKKKKLGFFFFFFFGLPLPLLMLRPGPTRALRRARSLRSQTQKKGQLTFSGKTWIFALIRTNLDMPYFQTTNRFSC